jgi:hypothetical protein
MQQVEQLRIDRLHLVDPKVAKDVVDRGQRVRLVAAVAAVDGLEPLAGVRVEERQLARRGGRPTHRGCRGLHFARHERASHCEGAQRAEGSAAELPGFSYLHRLVVSKGRLRGAGLSIRPEILVRLNLSRARVTVQQPREVIRAA